ncbi:MAG: hypothetical protein IJ272_06070 [Clostridia bacterium]|nr:hypothetical protein [Clostridia bacterium]
MDWLIVLICCIAAIAIISLGLACITGDEVFFKISIGCIVIFGIVSIITVEVLTFI